MKLITKDVDYAIKTLKHMAGKGSDLFSVSSLSEELGISLPYLRKILQRLNKKGLLSSFKGKAGGFKMARHASLISVHDVIEAFQGGVDLSNCFLGKDNCPDRNECLIRKNIKEIEAITVERFKSLTVASLMNKASGVPVFERAGVMLE